MYNNSVIIKGREGIDLEKQDKIKMLQDVIQIKSENGNEEEVALYLQTVFEKYGIDSELVNYSPERSSLVATIKNEDGPVLAYSGHMDVVSAGDETQWQYPPYAAVIEGDKLYGRGTTDMKSGLVAMAISMIEIKERGVPFKGTLKLLATVGEEIGELGAGQLTELGHADDIDALVIGEPSNYNLCYAHKGAVNYKIQSEGKEAHNSVPELGINAINNLVDCINRINAKMAELANSRVDEVLGSLIHNTTVIQGGVQVNSIPSYCEVEGNIRTVPSCDNILVKSEIDNIINELNLIAGYKLSVVYDNDVYPVKSSPESQLIHTIQKTYQAKFQGELPVMAIPGGTDASQFVKSKKEFDFVVFGPGEPTMPHKVDEYVSIKNYLEMIDIYVDLAVEYLNS